MIQPIVGIKLKNKSFVSLLNSKSTEPKQVVLYGDDFENGAVPVFLCKMQTEVKIQKIFKIGQIKISDEYLSQIQFDKEEKDSQKKIIRISSSLGNSGILKITVAIGQNKNFVPIKIYETDVAKEIETQDYNDLQASLLDYGDFVKCLSSDAELLPEEDISKNEVLKETYAKIKKEKANSKKVHELSDIAEDSKTSVAGKMVLSVMLVLFLVAAGIITLFAYNFNKNLKMKEKSFTREVNNRIENQISSKVDRLINHSKVLLEISESEFLNTFMQNDSDIIAVFSGEKEIYNEYYLLSSGLKKSKIKNAIEVNKASASRAKYGKTCIKNISHLTGQNCALLFFPGESKKYITIVFDLNSFEEICLNDSIYQSYVIDKKGFLLSGLNPEYVLTNQNLCDEPAVNKYLQLDKETKTAGFQFADNSYCYLTECDNGEFVVITTYRFSESNNITKFVSREVASLAVAIIVLGVIIIWFLGKRISTYSKALTEATKKIAQGDFNIHIKTSSRDELGSLTRAFDKMAESLILRDNAKRAMGRFAEPELEEKVEKGLIKLDGENKFSTIMFIGIRDFNNISKRFRPEELVEFLNNYYSVVEKVVIENGGYVDKPLGDTLMTTWGTPVSLGTPKHDAENAVKAAIKLKAAISDFNAELVSKGKPPVTLGFGINSGTVVAGDFGSTKNRSYTCIGPIVSVASAVEKMNKKYETRILVTESTFNLVESAIKAEEKRSISVNDSGESVKLYSVTGLREDDDEE